MVKGVRGYITKSVLKAKLSGSPTLRIHVRSDLLLGLVWVQIVCKLWLSAEDTKEPHQSKPINIRTFLQKKKTFQKEHSEKRETQVSLHFLYM